VSAATGRDGLPDRSDAVSDEGDILSS
jgi:hypothetical protein